MKILSSVENERDDFAAAGLIYIGRQEKLVEMLNMRQTAEYSVPLSLKAAGCVLPLGSTYQPFVKWSNERPLRQSSSSLDSLASASDSNLYI